MKTDLPQISFGKTDPSAHPFSPAGGTNGWTQTFYSNDTWNGKYTIPSDEGSEFDGENTISIFAHGADDSPLDHDEDLTYYDRNSTDPDILHEFLIDTTSQKFLS